MRVLLLLLMFLSPAVSAYRIEPGEYYVGGGLGALVNVAHFNKPTHSTPKGQMLLIGNIDYAVDKTWGVFFGLMPAFGSGSFGTRLEGGVKYWFTMLDSPFVPYVAAALTPAFLIDFNAPNHFNIGISPGGGLQYFVLANWLLGMHFYLNPSLAYANNEKRLEFSVTSYFNVLFKL